MFTKQRQLASHLRQGRGLQCISWLLTADNQCLVCGQVLEARNSAYLRVITSFRTGIGVMGRSNARRAAGDGDPA
eukprot:2953030-Pyramimonas_sp.AAC.1